MADDAHGSILPVRPSPSLRSVAPASARVGHLMKRARTFIETNREAVQCCLRDASTLLGPEPEELVIDAAKENTCRPGGLAAWQAERVLAFAVSSARAQDIGARMSQYAAH